MADLRKVTKIRQISPKNVKNIDKTTIEYISLIDGTLVRVINKNNGNTKTNQRKTINEKNNRFLVKNSNIKNVKIKLNDEKYSDRNKNVVYYALTQPNISTPRKIKLSDNTMIYDNNVHYRNNFRLYHSGIGFTNSPTSLNNCKKIKICTKIFNNNTSECDNKYNNNFSKNNDNIQMTHSARSNILKNYNKKNNKIQYIFLSKKKSLRSKSPPCKKFLFFKLENASQLEDTHFDINNINKVVRDENPGYYTIIKNRSLTPQLKRNNFRFVVFDSEYRTSSNLKNSDMEKINKTNYNCREQYFPLEKKYRFYKSPNKCNINKLIVKNSLNNNQGKNFLKLNKNFSVNFSCKENEIKIKKNIISRNVGIINCDGKVNNNHKLSYWEKRIKNYKYTEVKEVSGKKPPKKIIKKYL